MGLPIVTGGRSSSSRRLLPPALKDVVSCSCTYCGYSNSGHPHKVAFCSNESSSLTASLTVTYFHGREEEITALLVDAEELEFVHDPSSSRDSTKKFAQIEICITDISSNCHSITRRSISKYWIPLAVVSYPTTTDSNVGDFPTYICPKVIFSTNDRYLACLIPHGCCMASSTGSTLVIFRLELCLGDSHDGKVHLPLPSFLPQDTPNNKASSLRRAVDPRIVDFQQQQSLFVTCICSAAEPYLLAGCNTNGSIIAITWKRAKLVGIVFGGCNKDNNFDNHDDNTNKAISNMSYIGFGPMNTEQHQHRLAVICVNGTTKIYHSSSFAASTLQQSSDPATNRPWKFEYLCTLGNKDTLLLPSIDSTWINFCTLAVAVDTLSNSQKQQQQHQQTNFIACQVWEVASDKPNLISTLSLNNADIRNTWGSKYETATQLQPNGFNSRAAADNLSFPAKAENQSRSSIIQINCTYHHDSTIIISSAYYCQKDGVQSFICLWDWKSSTVGFLLGQQQLLEFSRAVIGQFGYSLHHVFIELNNKNSLVQDHYELSMLNPSETHPARLSSQQQVSSLLLSTRYVSFPLCSHATLSCQANVSPDTTVDFRETRIPISYTSIYGLVRVASIGRKFCRSIAVASSRGLCILDLSHMCQHSCNSSITTHVKQTIRSCHKQLLPCAGTITTESSQQKTECCSHHNANKISKKLRQMKWRMFSEQDESQFQVHAMAWWERNNGRLKQRQKPGMKNQPSANNNFVDGSNGVSPYSEDILFAVIEMMDNVSTASTSRSTSDNRTNKGFHLVCWSRRRLGLNSIDQLLVDVDKSINISNHTLGILLPPTSIVAPSAISILSLPPDIPVQNNNVNHERALLLIASLSVPYCFVVVELQICYKGIIPDRNEANFIRNSDNFSRSLGKVRILGRLFEGRITIPRSVSKEESSATSTITGMFLAGGSFDFDLAETNADQDNVRNPNSPFVNLGIITSNGSLFSVAFTAKLQHSVTGPVIVTAAHQSGVALYWQSDTLISGYSFNTGSYVWTICLRDGRMLMWSVPFFTRNDFRNPCDTSVVDNVGLFLSLSDKVFDLLNPYSKTKTSKSSLRLPILVRPVGEQHFLAPAFDCVLGEVYTLDSEMSSNNWTILGDKYLIGPLPSSSTFILSVGQRSRRFDCQGLTSLTCVSKGNNLFSLSNCALDPPSYTFSLLSLISQIVALKHLDSNGYRGHTDLATKLWSTVLEITKARAIDHSLDAALRFIIIAAVDMIHSLDNKNSIDELNRDLFTSLLLATVTIVKESLTPIHFSFFFLSLARQLEPRNFSILFPLRFSIPTSCGRGLQRIEHDNRFSMSIENLFLESIAMGTIAFAAAGLPMFSSHSASHCVCVKMLQYCLEVVAEDCASSDVEYHRLEEHAILRELFHYGLKVEDSLQLCHKADCRYTDSSESHPLSVDEAVDSKSTEHPFAKSGFFSAITSGLFSVIPPAKKEVVADSSEMDKEILDSAHSFIYYGSEGCNGNLLDTMTQDTSYVEVQGTDTAISSVSKKAVHSDRVVKNPTESVKTTVAIFFVSTLFSRDGFVPSSTCWKALGSISQILSDGPPKEYTAEFCEKISRALQNNFVIADILCETTEKLLQRHAVIMDDHSHLSTFLLSHILECSRQIGKRSCADLFYFSILLLQGISESHTTFDVLSTELAIILIITGHLTGAHDFIYEVLQEKETKFNEAFKKAAAAFDNVV